MNAPVSESLLANAVWDYGFFLFFLLYVSPLVLCSLRLARKICGNSAFERFAFVSTLTLAGGGASFGICGILGCLNATNVLFGNIAAGLLVYLVSRFLPERKNAEGYGELALSERILFGLLAGGIAARLIPLVLAPVFGTDSYMYHLYYPAVWIADGAVSRIPIIGLFPEYYPVFGELLYGWLMLPMCNSSVAVLLQWWSLATAAASCVMLSETLGFRRSAGLASGCLMFFTGIVMMNLIMAYTDVLNAAFCFIGFAFMIASCKRDSPPGFIFAGIVLGCSASIKPLGMMWTPVVTLVFSAAAYSVFRPKAKHLAALYAAAALTAFPFFIGNWVRTGNPFYPRRIAVGGFELFGPGIDAGVYAPAGLKNLPAFLFDGGIFGFNRASAAVYALLACGVCAVLILCLFRKPLRKVFFANGENFRLYLFLVPLLIVFAGVHAAVYPRIAEPRSLILLLLLWTLFFFPIAQWTDGARLPFACAAATLVFIVPMSYTTNFETFATGLGCAAAGAALFGAMNGKRKFRLALTVSSVLVLLLIPCGFTARARVRTVFYRMLFSEPEYRSYEVVRGMAQNGERAVIDYVGGVFGYVYLEEMGRNRVLYIPISEKDSAHVHEFGSYEAMRNSPAAYEVWLERLRKAGVNLLIVNTDSPALIFNRRQEIEWAEAHPERFSPLAGGSGGKGDFFMYQVNWE